MSQDKLLQLRLLQIFRSVLALCLLATLIAHSADEIFRPSGIFMSEVSTQKNPLQDYNFFFLMDIETARFIAIGVLLLAAIGCLPPLFGVLQWWITLSFAHACFLPDGGDQIASVLTLLMVPYTLVDRTTWSYLHQPKTQQGLYQLHVINISSVLLKLQIIVIYLQASLLKLTVEEWQNGTALYYWLQNPIFGISTQMNWFLHLLSNEIILPWLTWFVITLEVAICLLPLIQAKQARLIIVWIGLSLHLGILFVFGLPTFSLLMMASLMFLAVRSPNDLVGISLPLTFPFKARTRFAKVSF